MKNFLRFSQQIFIGGIFFLIFLNAQIEFEF